MAGEPRCKCGHFRINHGFGDCKIAGCDCVLYELADGNPPSTESSGVSRGSASAKEETSNSTIPLPTETPVLDIRSYDCGVVGDWNADVPNDVQRELMKCAQATNISFDYLCAIYRKGATPDEAAETPRSVDQARQVLETAIVTLLQVSSNHVDEFGRRAELAEGEVTLAINAFQSAVQHDAQQEIASLQRALEAVEANFHAYFERAEQLEAQLAVLASAPSVQVQENKELMRDSTTRESSASLTHAPEKVPGSRRCLKCGDALDDLTPQFEHDVVCSFRFRVQEGLTALRSTATVDSRRGQLWDAILDFADWNFTSASHRARINDAIDALIQQVGYHGTQSVSDSEPVGTERSAKEEINKLAPADVPGSIRERVIEAGRNEWSGGPQNIEGRIPLAAAREALTLAKELQERADADSWRALDVVLAALTP